MANIVEYLSPDRILRFVVITEDGGDISLGFDGFAWHTHADILASLSGKSEAEAVAQFVNEVLNSYAVIAVLRVQGKVKDVWVTDAPASAVRYLSEDESIELRRWNGTVWKNEERSSGQM